MKQTIISTITDETVNEVCWEGNDEKDWIIEDFLRYIEAEQKKGATHISIETRLCVNWGNASSYTHLITTKQEEESDEIYAARLKKEKHEKQMIEKRQKQALKDKEAAEKALFLKLKQKFEK